jgi:hypothetical protein
MVQSILQAHTTPRSGPTIGCVVKTVGLARHATIEPFAQKHLETVKRLSIYIDRPIASVHQIEITEVCTE